MGNCAHSSVAHTATVSTLVLVAAQLPVAWRVAKNVPEPFMDEIFHLPQTASICHGLTDWNPKITTFPGLYLLGSALAWVLSAVWPSIDWCAHATAQRGANLGLAVGAHLVLVWVRARDVGADPTKAAAEALVLSLLPTHFFFSFLQYTDVGSAFWVLLAHALATTGRGRAPPSPGRVCCAAVAGGMAVLFRQTNAVWLLFTFGCTVVADLQRSPKWAHRLGAWSPTSPPPTPCPLWRQVGWLAWALLCECRRLLWRFGLLLLPVVAFTAFVVLCNDGKIVLGDHANHQPVVHLAQLGYLSAAAALVFGLDRVLAPHALRSFLRECVAGSPAAFMTTAAVVTVVALGLARCSLAHPFLLADNRHLTFYLWGRLLGRWRGLKEALAPGYVYCGWFVHRELVRPAAQTPLWLFIWCIAVALTLVPAHLLEPRYFTTALLMLHAHAPPRSWVNLAAVGLGCALVNAATLWLFLERPFLWPDGSVARFMW